MESPKLPFKNFFSHLWTYHAALILVILIAYVPFLDIRMVRTTGDEKVYIAQALEMKALGHWFVQVLGGQPDYYKAPLHYLFLISGLKIFGLTLWSALYMNLLFCLAGAVALAEIIRESFPEKKEWPFWAGCFFAFNVGVYGHFFASQMEVELAGIFSLAFYFLWRRSSRGSSRKSSNDDLIFWLLAGLAGWLKSPLHSVLLGCSALLFWLLMGELWVRFRVKNLLCVLAGVSVCAIGFAPAFFLDRQNFIQFYFIRETIKPGNGGPWWQSLVPIVSYYLIPWMGVAFVSSFEFTVKLLRGQWKFKALTQDQKRLWMLGLATFVFTVGFFCYHPYHGENYTMPVTASVVMLILLFLDGTQGRLLQLRKVALGLGSGLVLVLAIGIQIVFSRFEFPKEVWPIWLMPLIWVIALGSFVLGLQDCCSRRREGIGIRSALSNVGLVTLLGIVLAFVGEMEVLSLKTRIREDRAQGLHYDIKYWDLNRLIWNEWGLMSLSVHEKIWPLLNEAELLQSIEKGDLILARDTDRGKEMIELARVRFPNLKPKVYEWNRWKTHAEDGEGHSLLGAAWEKRDLTLLFDHALILRFEK